MLISLRELNKLIPNRTLDVSIEKDINNLGYEVESVTKFSNVQGVKFGKIVDVQKNPNSKTLNIVTLQTNKGIKTIQTTASNPCVGYYTVYFPVGSTIGDITIGEKEMAGVVSEGMMAGFSELGFNPDCLPFDPDGIVLLNDPKIALDLDPMEFLGLNDYIIDITLPANRPDANSYYVLARELAAFYKTKFQWPNYNSDINSLHFKSKLKVARKDATELAFLESKITNNETSIQDILFLAKHNYSAKGIYSIDITNYVLIMTGTPAHVYDKSTFVGHISCSTYTGEVKLLGNKVVHVENVLAIKDLRKVLSLACVMGCEDTSVTKDTINVAFEIGVFDPLKIKSAAKQIKIDSNSSIQGAKGVKDYMCYNAILFLKHKLSEDNQLTSQIINLPKPKKGTSVLQNRRKLAIYANYELKDLKLFKDTEAALTALGFKINKNRIIAPEYRSDIKTYEDVIEEYFRFYGYSKFKPVAPFLEPFKINHQGNNKNWFKAMGYNEIRTFTLVSHENNLLNPFNFASSVALQTFVSKEREVVRNSIITSMLESAEYNLKRKMNTINFFETGMINNNNFVYGLVSNTKTFDEMKQDICNFLSDLELTFVPFKDNENVHPNVSAKIYWKDNFIGWLGKVHPSISKLDLWVAEFVNVHENHFIQFTPYDPSPLKTIDLTFELNAKENIQVKILEINKVSETFEIKQIDEFKHDDKRNVTLRITGTNEQINLINEHFNK